MPAPAPLRHMIFSYAYYAIITLLFHADAIRRLHASADAINIIMPYYA